ncbi:exopolygalacturonase-like [Aristolochia californica]|uniref:exopolygalacturonase-like n=1 Tax=Aristolochia californica TaxID=171875 RepID=UPI0035DAA5F2
MVDTVTSLRNQRKSSSLHVIFSFTLSRAPFELYNHSSLRATQTVNAGTFNVRSYGARGDGRTDDSKAFLRAWKHACKSTSRIVEIYVPGATYLVGPLSFRGPCRPGSIVFRMQGYLKASTNLKRYTRDVWVEFIWVSGLTLTGGGTFDGQGASSWPFNSCPKQSSCKLLPVNLKFLSMNDTVISGISSVNSKFFHMGVVACKKFQANGLRISAPENSPNTDGIHIERSSSVTIFSSSIATGDDCISVGHSNSDILISGVTCGPGHGISVGSLGKYPNEGDVEGLVVERCSFTGTTNGVRIKTWGNSPVATAARNMTFRQLVMRNVKNPIIIDQTYCPFSYCTNKVPSRVKLSDISFQNIQGTSATEVAVTLDCSRGVPCRNIHIQNVNLRTTNGAPVRSFCQNIKAIYHGTQSPPPCT